MTAERRATSDERRAPSSTGLTSPSALIRPPGPRTGPPAAGTRPRSTLRSHSAVSAAAGVALLALALRLWQLGRTNLWLDETGAVGLARKSVGEILENISKSPHGPAYYLLLKGWMGA